MNLAKNIQSVFLPCDGMQDANIRVADIDLPGNILDALSQLYWHERYPPACG